MGLDVYLYKYEDFETSKRINEDYEKKSEEIWQRNGGYDNLTDSERNLVMQEIRQLEIEMNIEKYQGVKIKINSSKYPKHLFKIGYFRSSNDDSGFNSVVMNATGSDLYTLLNPDPEQYEFVPDWKAAKEKVQDAIVKFKECIRKGEIGNYERGQEWDLQGLEIILETIDYVLNQPDPGKYALHWSD